MFEDRTYDSLLEDGKAQISGDILKSEGSFLHNALAIVAFELEKLYVQADYIWKQSDPTQADYDNLVTIAKARAVYPAAATPARFRLVANTEIPTGSRFSMQGFTFVTIGPLEDVEKNFLVECKTAGDSVNGLLGKVTAIDFVEGLKEASITELLVAGRNADTRKELLQKYIGSFKSSAFGGNVTEYKEHLEAFDGVGGAKIFPVWNGVGTVKGVLLGADFGPLSDYLVAEIQKAMCPAPKTGYGIAPIGHDCTIVSAEAVTVNVATNITFRGGYSWAVCRKGIEAAIADYLLGIRKAWKDGNESEYAIVYISRLESAVLDVDGVLDISGTTLNGKAANLTLTSEQVPIPGEVTTL